MYVCVVFHAGSRKVQEMRRVGVQTCAFEPPIRCICQLSPVSRENYTNVAVKSRMVCPVDTGQLTTRVAYCLLVENA